MAQLEYESVYVKGSCELVQGRSQSGTSEGIALKLSCLISLTREANCHEVHTVPSGPGTAGQIGLASIEFDG